MGAWRIVYSNALGRICDGKEEVAVHTLLQVMMKPIRSREFNAHMPTPLAILQRNTDCVLNMCALTAEKKNEDYMRWMIGGDMNLKSVICLERCREFLPTNNNPVVFTTSGWPQENAARQSDCIVCPLLDLIQVLYWVGKQYKQRVSDQHDAVVVLGHDRCPSHDATPQSLVAATPHRYC